MGKEPDPHACRPNSMDLNDAADMRDEAEQALTTRARPEENATCCTSRSWPASSSCSPAPYAEEGTSSSLPPSSPSRSHAPEAWHATA